MIEGYTGIKNIKLEDLKEVTPEQIFTILAWLEGLEKKMENLLKNNANFKNGYYYSSYTGVEQLINDCGNWYDWLKEDIDCIRQFLLEK